MLSNLPYVGAPTRMATLSGFRLDKPYTMAEARHSNRSHSNRSHSNRSHSNRSHSNRSHSNWSHSNRSHGDWGRVYLLTN